MSKYNVKKTQQLGMPHGTASNRMRKSLLWKYIKLAGHDVCFQCGQKINSEADLSIEHKTPWLDSENPVELYFDLDNIAFSHLTCNIKAGRRKQSECGTWNSYQKGCRCPACTEANRVGVAKTRANRRARTGRDR